jgi:two-component system response regulator MtrA
MCGPVALVVDHNNRRWRQIGTGLESLGFGLHKASTMPAAKEMVQKCRYRLVLVRFATLGKETFTFCSLVQDVSAETLTIVLMAKSRIKVEEQLFNCGVDDVVAGRQTSVRVLTGRIRAHLQYSRHTRFHTNTVMLKDTVVDLARKQARRDGSVRRLPGALTELLKYFLDNPDRVISREELSKSHLWVESICTPPEAGGKTIDVSIGKLRRIIESDPRRPRIITSVRGVGWKLGEGPIRWC